METLCSHYTGITSVSTLIIFFQDNICTYIQVCILQEEVTLYLMFCNQLLSVNNVLIFLTINLLLAPLGDQKQTMCEWQTPPLLGPASKLACFLGWLESGYVLFTIASYLWVKFFISSSKYKNKRQWDLNKDLDLY